MLFGREFHRAEKHLTVLLRFDTSDVVDEDRNGLAGVHNSIYTIETAHIIYVRWCLSL